MILWAELDRLDTGRRDVAPGFRARLDAMGAENARRQSLGAELLLYTALRRVYPGAGLPERAYRPGGKPYLPDFPDFHFSLSHSGSVALCAAEPWECGADVELSARVAASRVGRWFAPRERDYIEHNPDIPAAARIWCLREAFIKLDGRGLTLSRGSFSVLPEAGGDGLAEGCAFRLFEFGDYTAALCVRGAIAANEEPEQIELR